MHVVPQVCGGNAGLLLRAANLQYDGDLEAGVRCNQVRCVLRSLLL